MKSALVFNFLFVGLVLAAIVRKLRRGGGVDVSAHFDASDGGHGSDGGGDGGGGDGGGGD